MIEWIQGIDPRAVVHPDARLGERVTVAFQQCEKMCSGNAHSYLWPILNDRNKGSCA